MPTLPALDVKTNANYSPHIVILGAGASVAACPQGDARGRPLPVMANITRLLGLEEMLRRAGFTHASTEKFEVLYDEISASDAHRSLRLQLETSIREYFASLQLPKRATIYDLLLLSLRPKDVIATFNWDPFLLQAYARNRLLQKLPRVVFLHGNVYMGYCKVDRVKGYTTQNCEKCGKKLDPSPLLFPIRKKNYQDHPLLIGEWDELTTHLQHAYLLTIFGYAAPESDAAARDLLLKAWGKNGTRELAEIEIIDILPQRVLHDRWKELHSQSSLEFH